MFINKALENAAAGNNLEELITEEITFEIEEEIVREYQYEIVLDETDITVLVWLCFVVLIVLLARKFKF